jgi:NAD(P)-dependent dehydrogenase (short-subunit alcohol dehydrogenase family)
MCLGYPITRDEKLREPPSMEEGRLSGGLQPRLRTSRTPIVEAQIEAQARATGVPTECVVKEGLLAPQAVKRLLEPEEVAETASFLLGPGGRAVTDAPLVMDLGWTAR